METNTYQREKWFERLTTKSGEHMVVYKINGKIKFCKASGFHEMCTNYHDPNFDGTFEECVAYLQKQ